MCWVGISCVGLRYVILGLCWDILGWVVCCRLDRVVLGYVKLGCVGLGYVGFSWFMLGWVVLG